MVNDPKAARSAGICAGGYFGAAAAYLGNALAIIAVRPWNPLPDLAMAALPLACAAMGLRVLSGSHRAAKYAVVVAGGFAAIHLIGSAYLFLDPPDASLGLSRSLSWQLAATYLFLWTGILASALSLAHATRPDPLAGH
jgi:hypothetical protein